MPQRERPSGLVVIQPIRDWACADCGSSGDLLRMDDAGPLCLACADLGHLVFLPAGDAALTRRAGAASSLSAVVVRWSRTRKRYERQGTLVEEQALALAEQQCLSDEDSRRRRRERDQIRRAAGDEQFCASLANEIMRLFPGCPPGRATAIARHTGLRGSGRVGRTAAAHWTGTPSRWRWSRPYVTRTPITTRSSCQACRVTPLATRSEQSSTGPLPPGANCQKPPPARTPAQAQRLASS